MPRISVEDNHLTVLNLFTTDTPDKQDRLIEEMSKIVDAAAYDGWISSTVHAGVDSPGTANFIQWRSGEDLQKRYAGEEFKHRTQAIFGAITTSIQLLQNEIAFTQEHPSLGGTVPVSPERDDYTVIDVCQVGKANQGELIEALGPSRKWLLDVPGYRSHSVLKGLAARGLDGTFAVVYSQWDGKAEYDAYRSVPKAERSAERLVSEARIEELAISSDSNTYRVVHTRSAGE